MPVVTASSVAHQQQAAAFSPSELWKAVTDQDEVLQVFTALYNTDDNCLVAAPTGSGKTACAEFAVLRMIQKASQDRGAARCVYIAPLPGLARERMADWSPKVRLRLFLRPLLVRIARHSLALCQITSSIYMLTFNAEHVLLDFRPAERSPFLVLVIRHTGVSAISGAVSLCGS